MIRDAIEAIPSFEPGCPIRNVCEVLIPIGRIWLRDKGDLRAVRSYFAKGELVGFGYPQGETARVRIPKDLWPDLTIDFKHSLVHSDRTGHRFSAVVVYPAGRAPFRQQRKQRTTNEKHGRPKGYSYEAADAKILAEMDRLLENVTAQSPTDAVKRILKNPTFEVKGASDKSKFRRLVGRYKNRPGRE